MEIKERFLNKVKKNPITGCWEWTASKDNCGYGMFSVGSKTIGAHRASYTLFIGPIEKKLCVCHKCDNPGCVNPDHLFTGAQKENMIDAYDKGRLFPIIERSPFVKGHTVNGISRDRII